MKKKTDNNFNIFIKRFFLPLLTVTAVMSGCAHEMKEPVPNVTIPESFTQTGLQPLPGEWWMSLDDPALDHLIRKALTDNLTIKSAWERLKQSEAAAEKAGSGMFPSLDLDGGAARKRIREYSDTTRRNEYSLGLSATYELDLWGRINSSHDAALYDAKASAEDLLTARLTVSSQVASAWYGLVETYGQLSLLGSQTETNRQVLRLVTLQFKSGKVGAADVLQQRQLVESNLGEKVRLESEAAVLENRLCVLTGLPPGELALDAPSVLKALPPLPDTGIPSELMKRRPDIRSALYTVMSADSTVAAAIADRYPRISISAGADTSARHTRDLFDNWIASLAANLLAPVVDGGGRKAEVKRTEAAASQALNDYGQTLLTALEEVENALLQEKNMTVYIRSMDRQLRLAEQVVKSVRDRYTKGAENYQRVLDALLIHQKLERSRLTAARELIQYRIDLCMALGGGWEEK